jgi:hypothetical protein
MGMMGEQKAAQRLSERIEGMLDIKEKQEADDLLDTAHRLAGLNDLFGPPNPAFEQRLTARIEARLAKRLQQRGSWHLRLTWVGALAMLLIMVGLFTTPGRAVVAELMAVFRLGRTEVRVEPEIASVDRTFTATAETTLSGLPEARVEVEPRILQVPTFLPQGYQLHRVSTSHFEELPAWVQPLFVDVIYQRETTEIVWELAFRQYFVASGGLGTISALTYPPKEFESVLEVSVGDHRAVLLTKRPVSPVQPSEQILHLVWEGENTVFTLTSAELTRDEIVRVAESVVPYR